MHATELNDLFDEAAVDHEASSTFNDQSLAANLLRADEGFVDFEDWRGDDARDPQIIGADERRLVSNTKAWPYRLICNIEYRYSMGMRSMCSGTLVGPRTVLTAGHCVANKSAAKFRVTPGRNLGTAPFGASRVKKVILFPRYRGAARTDLALMILDKPLGATVGFWSQAYRRQHSDRRGTRFATATHMRMLARRSIVNVSGYPADKPAGAGCTSRTGRRVRCFITSLNDPRRSARCGTEPWRSSNRVVSVRGGMIHYLSDTCPGHSGSPMWLYLPAKAGGRILVGVHVAGDDRRPGTTVANRGVILTPVVQRWIARHRR